MKLLNPLFDTVFKYLLEDLDIAKAIIEAVIKKEITELYPSPQESSSHEIKIKYSTLAMIRQDFVAVIKSVKNDGSYEYEKVIIEVQKSPVTPEIARFRNYLSDKYRKKSSIGDKQCYLPIKTIYLLEDIFNPSLPAILGRRGVYYDEIENTIFKGDRDEIVELFNHDSWFIQTEKLPLEFKEELMYVLSVFAPQYRKSKSDKYINIPDREIFEKKHRILSLIYRRLEAATGNSEINQAVEIEMEYEKYIETILSDNENYKTATINALKQAEQDRAEKEKAMMEIEKERAEKEKAMMEIEKALLNQAIFKSYFINGSTVEEISKNLGIEIEMINKILSGS